MNRPAPATLGDAGRRQLQGLLTQLAGVANRLKPTARLLTGIATLSALWLAFQLQAWTGASLLVAGLVLAVLALPALLVGWLWWLLVDIAELPGIAARLLGGDAPDPAATPGTGPRPGVGEAFRLGGSLRQAARLAWEFESLRGVIVGALVLANPVFLVLLGLALAATVMLGLAAALTGLGVLLF